MPDYKLYTMKCPPLKKTEKWCDSHLVEFPVSHVYNGGIVIEGDWYDGYAVDAPIVPEGYELVSIYCGLQLNAQPPLATMYLKKIELPPFVPVNKGEKGSFTCLGNWYNLDNKKSMASLKMLLDTVKSKTDLKTAEQEYNEAVANNC